MDIYLSLRGSRAHPNADAVFRRARRTHPHISFDTVNRTLLLFARIGLLSVVEGHGLPKRFDPNPERHHHFHCRSCHRIIDVYESSYDALPEPSSLSPRHEVLDKKVVLEGFCDRCRT